MDTAKDLFDAGRLQAAIEEVTREVKARPSDMARRSFLFELLCFAGEWDRAEKQLDVIGSQNPQSDLGATIYRRNIKAERKREQVLAGEGFPNFMLEPPSYVALQLKAISQIGAGDFPQALATIEQAAGECPVLSGDLDGKQFENFRDADDLVSYALEVFLQGEYLWLPFEQIRNIEILAPAQLRDLIWTQARVTTIDGVKMIPGADPTPQSEAFKGEVFIPVLYVNSHRSENDQARLGRLTDWRQRGEGIYTGVGQRLFLADDDDKAILEVRTINFKSPDSVSSVA